MSFLAELKRRNVFKVGAAYAIVGWLLVQIAGTLFPLLQLPDWTATFVAAVVVLGFPIALLLSWAFELTPDGIKQTRHVPIGTSIRHITGQQLNYVVTSLLVVAMGFLFAERYLLEDATTSARSRGALENSIAVLPFANLSPNPDDAFFAAGIHEEILNQLAKLRDLHVIARTSVLRYADGTRSIPEIAEELNVATVMEGSVRYADDRVLVTAQLIDPRTNAHLWSESYNRAFSDIFMIQADIATNIARALETELSLAERETVTQVPTRSAEAYALFLRARESQRGGSATFSDRAWSEDLDRAIALDPDFAQAYALKASLYNINVGTAAENWEAIVRENAEKALAIDPALPLAYQALGYMHQLNWRWAEAERALRRAIELSPGDGDALLQLALFERDRGNYAESLEFLLRAAELMPNDVGVVHQLGVGYRHVRNFASAAERERTAITLVPDGINAHVGLAQAEAMLGNDAAAFEHLQISERLGAAYATFRIAQMILVYVQLDRRDDALRLEAELARMSETADYSEPAIAFASIALGEYDRAYDFLRQSVDMHSPERISLIEIKSNYWGDSVLEEPRFRTLRDRIGN